MILHIFMLSIVLVFSFIIPDNVTETSFNNDTLYNYMTTHQDNTINTELKETFSNNEVLLQKENDENININKKETKRINQKQELNDDKCNNICMTKSCINTGNTFLAYFDFGENSFFKSLKKNLSARNIEQY